MTPAAYEDEQQPKRLGRYDLLRRIAVGGMAEIFLARSGGLEGFEKLVVCKRILPQYAENPEFTAMFIDEARLVAGLSHPNIAQVYDIGLDDQGSYFFAMEFVDGEDVRQILRASARQERRVDVRIATAVAIGIAAGLHAAHERRGADGRLMGIVHRDVSPSNVLVTYDGCVKLVDFGIAKAAGRQAVTRTGVLKGKCAYMSPEQTQGGPLDRRSDVFALGILLYEVTVGHRPFRGDNEYQTMKEIVAAAPEKPSAVIKHYPKELERIVLRALAKKPEDRYPSARALQVDLEKFAREERLDVSTVALADFMQELFADKLEDVVDTLPGQSAQLSRVLRGLSKAEGGRTPAEAKVRPGTAIGVGPVGDAERPAAKAPMNLTHVSIAMPRKDSVYSLSEELQDTPTVVVERKAIAAKASKKKARGGSSVPAEQFTRDASASGAKAAAKAKSSSRPAIIAAVLGALIIGGAAVAGHMAGKAPRGDEAPSAPASAAAASTSAPVVGSVSGGARGDELPSPAAVPPPVAMTADAAPVVTPTASESGASAVAGAPAGETPAAAEVKVAEAAPAPVPAAVPVKKIVRARPVPKKAAAVAPAAGAAATPAPAPDAKQLMAEEPPVGVPAKGEPAAAKADPAPAPPAAKAEAPAPAPVKTEAAPAAPAAKPSGDDPAQ